MNYSISLLNNTADCGIKIDQLNELKSDLEYRKTVLQHRIDNNLDTATEIASEMLLLNSDLSHLNSILPTMTPGFDRDDILNKINDTENDIIDLEIKRDSMGIPATLKRELDMNMLNRSLARNEDLLNQVISEKAELPT